jgi:antagonist of KipI
MGYRLEGPPLRHMGPADILSDATPVGSLQVPASGQPILLMADRQTTGGYPKDRDGDLRRSPARGATGAG